MKYYKFLIIFTGLDLHNNNKVLLRPLPCPVGVGDEWGPGVGKSRALFHFLCLLMIWALNVVSLYMVFESSKFSLCFDNIFGVLRVDLHYQLPACLHAFGH